MTETKPQTDPAVPLAPVSTLLTRRCYRRDGDFGSVYDVSTAGPCGLAGLWNLSLPAAFPDAPLHEIALQDLASEWTSPGFESLGGPHGYRWRLSLFPVDGTVEADGSVVALARHPDRFHLALCIAGVSRETARALAVLAVDQLIYSGLSPGPAALPVWLNLIGSTAATLDPDARVVLQERAATRGRRAVRPRPRAGRKT